MIAVSPVNREHSPRRDVTIRLLDTDSWKDEIESGYASLLLLLLLLRSTTTASGDMEHLELLGRRLARARGLGEHVEQRAVAVGQLARARGGNEVGAQLRASGANVLQVGLTRAAVSMLSCAAAAVRVPA